MMQPPKPQSVPKEVTTVTSQQRSESEDFLGTVPERSELMSYDELV